LEDINKKVMLEQKTIEVLPLFPSPLFTALYTKNDLSKTIDFLDNSEMMGTMTQDYGHHSKDTYILEAKECEPLKNFIIDSVNFFGKNIMMYDYEEYSLSQSWISIKNPGQHHTMHTHPNSLISGVFYYGEDDPDMPAISFHKPIFATNVSYISPKYQNDRRKSEYAWDVFSVNYSPGLLLIFPSHVFHSVPVNKSKMPRKSIAFNVMPKEKIGDTFNLTELLFKKVI
jgi:uncharacterized protein (TIGR02466 family)